jgi:DNA-binding NarL/FixJ family response regulator
MSARVVVALACNDVVAAGLARLLEADFEVHTLNELPARVDLGVDVTVCFVRTADDASIIKRIRARLPGPVLALTGQDDAELARCCLGSGAAAVVPWDHPRAALVASVHAVIAGHAVMPRDVAWTLASDASVVISDRERHWLEALAAGDTVGVIADRSGYAQRTVYRLLRDLYGRLGTNNRTEAVAIAVQRGLISPPGSRGR